MKGRPNMDVDAFLTGGTADSIKPVPAQSLASVIPKPPPKAVREQKVFRLPVTMIDDLRRVVFHHSALQNRRVTETEIVELAIQAFIDSQAI